MAEASPPRGPAAEDAVRALVVLSSVKWDFAWQRHHSLARAAAAAGARVVFVEPHPRSARQVLVRLARRRRGDAAPVQPVPAGVRVLRWTPLDLVPGVTLRRIRRALPARGEGELLVLQYVPSRRCLALARRLRPDRFVYDRVLDWARVPAGWFPPRGWRAVEAALESRARLATDSPVMHREWAARGSAALLVLPAADDEFVRHAWREPPPDGPVGYFGTVQRGIIDLEQVAELARSREVEIVGDVDEESRAALLAAGARLRPAVPLAELPPIIERWSAILLPYRVGDRQETLVPAKIWNALATGRPVLTSGLALPDGIARHTVRLDAPGAPPAAEAVRAAQPVPLDPAAVPSWADAWRRLAAFAAEPGPAPRP